MSTDRLQGVADGASLAEELEAIVDKHGIGVVLRELGTVAADRAEHITTNWQDDALAKVWLDTGMSLLRLGLLAKRL